MICTFINSILRQLGKVLVWVCIFFHVIVQAQFLERPNITESLATNSGAFFGSGTSFFDFNDDGWDDITYCTNDVGVHVLLNTGSGFEYKTYFANIEGMLMHPTWIDIDNDGDNDFFVSRFGDKPVLMLNDGNFNFTDISDHLPCPIDHPNGTSVSWGDYDGDSFPDLYISNNEYEVGKGCWLFHNLGNSYFEEISAVMNMFNEARFAFQCLWIDYERDGDLDMIVVNDRYGGIRLYEQQSDGTFIDIAPSNGFNIESDLMGLTAGDYDHDSDFDFVTTNNLGNVFLVNDNGQFYDQASTYNMDAICSSWSCPFIDSNNDTWEDVYIIADFICGTDTNYYYHNAEGNYLISYNNFIGDHLPGFSCSRGDFNRDGRYDLISSNQDIVTVFQVWENQFEAGHQINITLEGIVSNRHGIGSIVDCFVGGEKLMRPFTCGDSYLSQDSQHLIIGIGDAAIVDSLQVHWPSGWVDTFYNITADSSLVIVEGMSALPQNTSETITFCPNDTLLLSANEGLEYQWNNDENTQSILVDTVGTYHVWVTEFPGLTYMQEFEVIPSTLQTPAHTVVAPTCFGSTNGSIDIAEPATGNFEIQWSDVSEINSMHREQLGAGNYQAYLAWTDGCTVELSFELIDPAPLSASFSTDTICIGDSTSIECLVTGGTSPYEINWHDINPQIVYEGIYNLTITDSLQCSLDTVFHIISFEQPELTFESDTVCFGSFTQVEIFPSEYIVDYTLEFDPEIVYAGQYPINYVDIHGCQYTQQIEIFTHEEITLTTILNPPSGSQEGTLSIEVNGGAPPYDCIWDDGHVGFVRDVTSGVYHCVVTDGNGCSQEITVEVANDIHEEQLIQSCFPNPFHDKLYIEVKQSMSCVCYDLLGKQIHQQQLSIGQNELNTSQWSCGFYLIEVNGHHLLMEKK